MQWDRWGDPNYIERRDAAEDAEDKRRHERRVLGNFLADARQQAHDIVEVMQVVGGDFLHGVDPSSEIVSWRRDVAAA